MAIASATVNVLVSCVPVRTPLTARPPASIQTKLSPRLFSCCSTRACPAFPIATTQMTAAIPIVIPRTVKMLRILAQGSWSESISPFHGESSLAHLRRICRGNAGELRPDVIDDVKIDVGTVVVSQAKIGADGLRVRCVHLDKTGECQKPSEGIVRLEACQHYRKIAIRQRQSKSIPGLGSGDRELRSGPIIGPHTKFIQSPSVITTKAFEEIVGKPPVLPGSVRDLMAGEVIQTVRNKDIFVDVKRTCDSLCKHIGDIIVGVCAVLEFGSKSSLPLLGLHSTLSVRR